MPNPRPGESRDDFLDRCIPEVIGEGREPDQAVAMCIAFYEGEKDKAFNLKDGDRVAFYKAFERRRESFEPKYMRVFNKAIKKQLSIYEDADTINDLRRDIDVQPLKEAYLELYKEVGDAFARAIYSGMKKMPYPETKQQPAWIERMVQIVERDLVDRIQGVTDTIKKQIREIIIIGIEEGLSTAQIKALIIGNNLIAPLNGTLDQRVRRIIRTEMVYASNRGSLEGALASNVEFDKVWSTTPDGNARDAHEDADGQTVNKSAPFFVGGEYLSVPGDPNGSPENIINCRCTQTYITPEGEI
jgi:uncharacterized protein with gpF-like domain